MSASVYDELCGLNRDHKIDRHSSQARDDMGARFIRENGPAIQTFIELSASLSKAESAMDVLVIAKLIEAAAQMLKEPKS